MRRWFHEEIVALYRGTDVQRSLLSPPLPPSNATNSTSEPELLATWRTLAWPSDGIARSYQKPIRTRGERTAHCELERSAAESRRDGSD